MAAVKVRLSEGDIRLRLTEFEVATVLEGREVVTSVTDGLAVHLTPVAEGAQTVEGGAAGHAVKVPFTEVKSPSMANPYMYESPPGEVPHILVEMDRQT